MSKKSRKLIRSRPAESAASAEAPLAEQPVTRYFWFLPDEPTVPVDEKALHDQMKQWRHGRATRTLWDAIQDAYVAVFGIVLIGAMVVSAVMSAQSATAGCNTASCATSRTLLPWATVAAVTSLALILARMFGPVLASAAEGFWMMDAPISRARLLRGRLVLALTGFFLLGGLSGALVAALTGSSIPMIVGWGLAAALISSGLTAYAAVEQRLERRTVLNAIQVFLGLLSLLTLVGVVASAAGWIDLQPVATHAEVVAWGLAALGLALLVGALFPALRGLDGIRRARLLSGGSLVSGMQGAMYALDLGLIRDIIVDRAARERGHVKPAPGRGKGVSALVWRDLERLRRFPGPLVGWAVTMIVPYAAEALGWTVLNPFLSGLALVAALVPFMNTLRVLTRTKGLARVFPFTNGQLRTSAMLIPGVFAALWAVAVAPAFAGVAAAGQAGMSWAQAAVTATITALAGFLGAVRWVTAKPVDFSVPMMATGAGAMPPSLMFNLFRGLDIVALVTAPIMAGWSAYISLGIAMVVFLFLRTPLNTDDLKEQQERAKRELEESRAERDKIRVARPGR